MKLKPLVTWTCLAMMLTLVACMIHALAGAALVAKVGSGIVTGVALGAGFLLKDSLAHHVKNWKQDIESNLSHGRFVFHNVSMAEKWRWRLDPVKYQQEYEEWLSNQADEAATTTDDEITLSPALATA